MMGFKVSPNPNHPMIPASGWPGYGSSQETASLECPHSAGEDGDHQGRSQQGKSDRDHAQRGIQGSPRKLTADRDTAQSLYLCPQAPRRGGGEVWEQGLEPAGLPPGERGGPRPEPGQPTQHGQGDTATVLRRLWERGARPGHSSSSPSLGAGTDLGPGMRPEELLPSRGLMCQTSAWRFRFCAGSLLITPVCTGKSRSALVRLVNPSPGGSEVLWCAGTPRGTLRPALHRCLLPASQPA